MSYIAGRGRYARETYPDALRGSGAQGPQGAQGANGTQGAQGANGAQGAQGRHLALA